MFKFNFDLDDLADDPDLIDVGAPPTQDKQASPCDNLPTEEQQHPCKEIQLQKLIDSLPTVISCSPLTVPLRDGTKSVTLTRRDLFDARFQLIAEGTERSDSTDPGGEEENAQIYHASALKFIEAPSDLVPCVYEGGLKTWECSIDLVEYLDSTHGSSDGFLGKHILELGCGTAIPSLYILHHIFSSTPPNNVARPQETALYLQDYNDSVLELVTLPNILLTWYLSPASSQFRASDSTEDLPFPIIPEPFDLPISPSLKSAFLTSLQQVYNISIRLFSGSWSSLATQLPTFHPNPFDLVLTSETIYRMDSLPSLVDIMRLACSTSKVGNTNNSEKEQVENRAECLVASKVIYFGVGGGVSEFVHYVKEQGLADTQTVREHKSGVGRVILSLAFV